MKGVEGATSFDNGGRRVRGIIHLPLALPIGKLRIAIFENKLGEFDEAANLEAFRTIDFVRVRHSLCSTYSRWRCLHEYRRLYD
jgi:hypothetical protein